MEFFRNGECQGVAFNDMHAGVYYPTASLFKGATVKFNFGPDFKYPPQDRPFRAVSAELHLR